MSRAAVGGFVVLLVAPALAGCSGGSANAYGSSPACPLLAQLAHVGQTVARADVSDPAAFDSTLRDATTQYVRTARRLRAAVPARLRDDVDRLIAAAEQRRFAEADAARAGIDAFADGVCKT